MCLSFSFGSVISVLHYCSKDTVTWNKFKLTLAKHLGTSEISPLFLCHGFIINSTESAKMITDNAEKKI